LHRRVNQREGEHMGYIVNGHYYESNPPHNEVIVDGVIYRPGSPQFENGSVGQVTMVPNGDGTFSAIPVEKPTLKPTPTHILFDRKPSSIVVDGHSYTRVR
jgi:hypothetical protein